VVADVLASHTTPEKDLIANGFLANNQAEELECEEFEVLVLKKSADITARVHAEIGENATEQQRRNYFRQIERNIQQQGLRAHVAAYYGGAQYVVYVYTPCAAKLVFAPDLELGRFGGEEDNFSFPRHSLDFALLRCYENGAPKKSRFMPLSEKGAAENDPLFMTGFPGRTERHLAAAHLEYLRDVEMPIRVAATGAIVDALSKYMERGVEQKKKANPVYKRSANENKLFAGTLNFLKNSDYIARRSEEEKEWRKKISENPAAQKIAGNSFDEVKDVCGQLSKEAGFRQFLSLPPSPAFQLAQSLNSFLNAIKDKPEERVELMKVSFLNFLDNILPPDEPIDLDAEQIMLTAWLNAALKTLPPESPFLKTMLKGQTPSDAAAATLKGCDCISSLEKMRALLQKGGEALENLEKLPLIACAADLRQLGKSDALINSARLEKRRDDASAAIVSALHAIDPKMPPEASSTMRIGWGKVSGYKDAGVEISWCTTFETMLARAELKGNAPPFVVSERFKKARATLDLKAPLNFVTSSDGAPGCSGSPLFNKDCQIAGVLFDGNQQRVASMYAYIPPENGARSIAVHSAAIFQSLEHIYDAKDLVNELRDAGKK
jgi:hypothetical protein